MIKEVIIPNLGLTMEKAKISEWVKQEAIEIKSEEEIILTIETDKISYEINAPQKGFLHIIGQVGEEYPVGKVIAWIAQTKEEYESYLQKMSVEKNVEIEEKEEEKISFKIESISNKGKNKPFFAVPLARKIAEENGIDLTTVIGTGPNGRITKEDVLKVLEIPKSQETKKIKEIIPISGRRAIIFKHMHQSLQQSAQTTHMIEVNASELVHFRKTKIDTLNKKISYNAILLKILGFVLEQYPKFNSSVEENQIILWKSINICLAIDTEEGLITPVIQNINKKDLKTIQQNIDDLIEQVKTKKLMLDNLKGGTFTLSNLGSLDIETFTPIINYPEVAILGIGKISEKPLVINGEIKIGLQMMLSLTYDHRIIDGAEAARFLKKIKEYIENIEKTQLQ